MAAVTALLFAIGKSLIGVYLGRSSFSGFGAAVLPASAAPYGGSKDWVAIPFDDIAGRTVGLAQRRPGMPSAAARTVAKAIVEVVTTSAAHQGGIRARTSDVGAS